MLYITGLAGGSQGYFTDQNGKPRLLVHDSAWALPTNAGRWNSGNWQADYDTYLNTRAAQGFTAWQGIVWGNLHISGVHDDGRTWDGIYPLTVNGTAGPIVTGSETVALNNSFWTRIDYFVSQAQAAGITLLINLGMSYDMGAGQLWANLSTTQATAFGNALATRYASSPNIIWFAGDDYFGNQDNLFSAMLTGIRNAGDTRPASMEYSCEYTSREDLSTGLPNGLGQTYGVNSATYNWVYSYNVSYFGVEQAYLEATNPIPIVYGDGFYWGDAGGTGAMAETQAARRMCWWALASGARGTVTSSESIVPWGSGAIAELTAEDFSSNVIGKIRACFESLPGWWQLVPDTSSSLVTAGRGTRATSLTSGCGGGTNFGPTDTYVAASRASGGSLAVLYCGQHFSVTIDQAKMVAGYTATWVDPATCATTPTTTGSTYNSTGLGNNSAGFPDWVLVLQAPQQLRAVPPVTRRWTR